MTKNTIRQNSRHTQVPQLLLPSMQSCCSLPACRAASPFIPLPSLPFSHLSFSSPSSPAFSLLFFLTHSLASHYIPSSAFSFSLHTPPYSLPFSHLSSSSSSSPAFSLSSSFLHLHSPLTIYMPIPAFSFSLIFALHLFLLSPFFFPYLYSFFLLLLNHSLISFPQLHISPLLTRHSSIFFFNLQPSSPPFSFPFPFYPLPCPLPPPP